ncbi:putative helicase-like protein (nucleomorph) [Guillardia theta]|uniref:Helicase-like protein n=1 Tax=Guillardia theta TaxID=55529 RepID=Q9SEA2_GUITH|nr:putative helicase-like protein [Guillardia theta]AAF24214.1 putative helicase-like protein [Guillardia theta]
MDIRCSENVFITFQIIIFNLNNLFIYCTCYNKSILFRKLKNFFKKLLSNLKYNFKLDNFQLICLNLMYFNVDIFVAAHTSSGKTLVGEQVIFSTLKLNKRVIYLSPIKALSNQKFEDFKNIFYNVGIITGDQIINPDANCVIMTTEIFRLYILNNSNWLKNINYIIIDEAHFIFDETRGFVWEEIIIITPGYINIIYLSATISNLMEMSEWIFITRKKILFTIKTDRRIIPLVNYIYLSKIDKIAKLDFFLKNKNLIFNYKKGIKINFRKNSIQDFNQLIRLLKNKNLLPLIYFIFNKKKCILLSKNFMKFSFLSIFEKNILNRLLEMIGKKKKFSIISHELDSYKNFWILLLNGIAVHNSDISIVSKKLIEILFQVNLIKILFATETFSIGLNMPAKTVVFHTLKKFDGNKIRKLRKSEFIQMSGRAGRRGIDHKGFIFTIYRNNNDFDLLNSIINKTDPNPNSIYKLSVYISLKLSCLDNKEKINYFSHLISSYKKDKNSKIFYRNSYVIIKRKNQNLNLFSGNNFSYLFFLFTDLFRYFNNYSKISLQYAFEVTSFCKRKIYRPIYLNEKFFLKIHKFLIFNKTLVMNLIIKLISSSIIYNHSKLTQKNKFFFFKMLNLEYYLNNIFDLKNKNSFLLQFEKISKSLKNMGLIGSNQRLNKKAEVCIKSRLDENLILLELIYNGFFLKKPIEVIVSILSNFELHLGKKKTSILCFPS